VLKADAQLALVPEDVVVVDPDGKAIKAAQVLRDRRDDRPVPRGRGHSEEIDMARFVLNVAREGSSEDALRKELAARLDGWDVDVFLLEDRLADLPEVEIQRPKARVCAGCGAPGTEDEDAAPGQVALHWKVREVMVCIDCHAKERGKGSQVEGADQDRALAQIVGLLRAARVLSVKGSQLCEVLEEGLGVARAALETPPRSGRPPAQGVWGRVVSERTNLDEAVDEAVVAALVQLEDLDPRQRIEAAFRIVRIVLSAFELDPDGSGSRE